jgi:multidrug efflux pump subunit AcrA (membrane-fusion protein)
MNVTRNRRRWLLLGGGAVAVGVVALLYVTGAFPGQGASPAEKKSSGQAARKEPATVAVVVAPVTVRTIQRKVQVVGTLYGHEEITLTPKVDGRVVKIHHDVGDRVKAGDVLLEMEQIDYQLAVTETEKALELELAKLGLTELPDEAFDLKKLPSVVRAGFLRENAARKLERAVSLGKAVAREDREQMETDFHVALAMYEQTTMEAQATLAAARHRQAVLEMTRQRLRETTMRAPDPLLERARRLGFRWFPLLALPIQVEYVVAQRMVSVGEMVRGSPPVAVFRLVMDRPLKLQAVVPERHVAEVQVGQAVALSVEAYPKEVFRGIVARVNPTVDRASRTFQIEVHVPNQDHKLRPGSFVKAAIATRIDPQALTVPEEALVSFAGVTKVFLVRDGKAQEVQVRPRELLEVPAGKRVERWVEVVGELPAQAQVVTSGHSQLAQDTPVRKRGR